MDGIAAPAGLSPASEPMLRDVSAELAQAAARLARLADSTRTFGVIRMWPDAAVAEHENVERLRDAARLIGATVIELDRYGRMLGSPGEPIDGDQVDFVLHLHFETPKVYDAISIAAMWNPMQFYVEWGFERHWSNQMSHDIFATTGAREIERLLAHERGVTTTPMLNHGIAEPIYLPAPKDRYRAFYCGINWEKVDGRPGRHGPLLRALDAQGRLDLFGPEIVQGVKVWEGYAGYRGSLPFDGKTIIRKVADAGACLVLSSEAHRASGIMSNRLFEALAAGAVVIGDDHPFIPRAIGANFVHVPSHLPAARRAALIVDALATFERNPGAAVRMAAAAQDCMLRSFHLPMQIAGLFEAAAGRRAERQRITRPEAAPCLIDFVLQPIGMEAAAIHAFADRLAAQFGRQARLIMIAGGAQAGWFRGRFAARATVVEMAGEATTILSPSDLLNDVAPHLTAPKVVFCIGIETFFAAELIACANDFAGRPVGRIGHVQQHHDDAEKLCFDYRAPHDPIEQFHAGALAAIMFDRDWLLNAPQMPGLSWQGLVKLGEMTDDTIAAHPSTALVLDLKQYERGARRGFHAAAPSRNEAAVVARLGSISAAHASGLVLWRGRGDVPPPPQERAPKLVQAEFVTLFRELPPSEKLSIGLQIYKSLPMPRWLRWMITLARKAAGIR